MKNTEKSTITIEKLQEENEILKQQKADLEVKLKWLEEKYKLGLQRKYGCSSEQIDGQINIFNEAEIEAKPDIPEPIIEEIIYKRKKSVGHREAQLEDLPVEIKEYRLTEQDQVCSCCGGFLHEMSTEVRQELKIIPAEVKVVKHIKYIYSCRACEKEKEKTPIVKALAPNPVIPGSLASPSIMAYVMSRKFVESLPLYRQEVQFKYLGIKLSRQTLANWMIKGSELWLSLIYSRMKHHLEMRDILHADETTLQVLHEEGREAKSKSYLWLYRTGREGPAIVIYEYKTTRAGKHPKKFLENFKGYIQVDGYDGYNGLPNTILVGCWAHSRRKFVDALKALPIENIDAPVIAKEGLNFCTQLFMIERELKNSTLEERYNARLERSRPVLDDFLAWLKYQKPRVLPKSTFGQAIRYCLNQWSKLEAFLLDGRLELDNNRSERSIKPFVIGRKNWLFANTSRGAESSATIYSIIETAKENGLNPYEYLKYLFEILPNSTVKDKTSIDKFLPWSDALPEICKVKKQITPSD